MDPETTVFAALACQMMLVFLNSTVIKKVLAPLIEYYMEYYDILPTLPQKK